MPAKTKVTVSLDRRLVEDVDRVARASGRSRSRVVEEALRGWRRRRFEAELRDGYRAMAEETRAASEEWLSVAAGSDG